ncbi:YcxB family protein [Achromobacter aloeverae]
MPATPPSYTVTYTERMVRDAVRTYVWRRGILGRKLLWILEIALLVLLAHGLATRPADWSLGVLACAVLLPPIFIATLWRAHHRNTVGKFHRLALPTAQIDFQDDGLGLRSDLGAACLQWPAITEIWERPGYWMIFTGPAQFMTLPTASIPDSALEFLRAKVGSGRRAA